MAGKRIQVYPGKIPLKVYLARHYSTDVNSRYKVLVEAADLGRIKWLEKVRARGYIIPDLKTRKKVDIYLQRRGLGRAGRISNENWADAAKFEYDSKAANVRTGHEINCFQQHLCHDRVLAKVQTCLTKEKAREYILELSSLLPGTVVQPTQASLKYGLDGKVLKDFSVNPGNNGVGYNPKDLVAYFERFLLQR